MTEQTPCNSIRSFRNSIARVLCFASRERGQVRQQREHLRSRGSRLSQGDDLQWMEFYDARGRAYRHNWKTQQQEWVSPCAEQELKPHLALAAEYALVPRTPDVFVWRCCKPHPWCDSLAPVPLAPWCPKLCARAPSSFLQVTDFVCKTLKLTLPRILLQKLSTLMFELRTHATVRFVQVQPFVRDGAVSQHMRKPIKATRPQQGAAQGARAPSGAQSPFLLVYARVR